MKIDTRNVTPEQVFASWKIKLEDFVFAKMLNVMIKEAYANIQLQEKDPSTADLIFERDFLALNPSDNDIWRVLGNNLIIM
jgi:hypothetical protein